MDQLTPRASSRPTSSATATTAPSYLARPARHAAERPLEDLLSDVVAVRVAASPARRPW